MSVSPARGPCPPLAQHGRWGRGRGNWRYHWSQKLPVTGVTCQHLLPTSRRMDAQKLTETAFAASGATSIRGFADLVGVSHVSVLAWLDGSRIPSFEHAAALAKIAGLPIVKTASEVRMAAPENARHKSILKHLAATATLLAVVVFPALPERAQAAPSEVSAAQTRHYAKWLMGLAWHWLAQRLRRPRPSPGNLEASLCA